MFNRLNSLTLFLLLVASIHPPAVVAQEVVVSKIQRINLSGNDIFKIDANSTQGFNFPFYLFIPETVNTQQTNYLYVETNNTGTSSDDFDVHLQKALQLVKRSYPNRIARRLHVPLLVPVFPRPRTNWQSYTHALDRDTLEIKEGPLKRIDLQLIAMIDYALQLLKINDIQMHDRIFMHGFSASAKFCNRFAFLHPKRVKAVAAGGVNGLPTLPLGKRNGRTLPFPIGIADIETITGRPYDEPAHKRVAQYVYMGYFDRNDTLPSRDAWSQDEANIIKEAVAARMMPDRWAISQAVYREKLPHAQCVTYNGVAHAVKNEMIDDIVEFFKANSTDAFLAIEPHAYPSIEYRELKKVHVNGMYCKDDSNLPKFVGKGLREDVFLIGIKQWRKGQSHRQLDEFVENAGFNFVLRAEGHPDIVIDEENYGGNSSMGDGRFQAFYVNLTDHQLKVLADDTHYTLHPENKSDQYVWLVEDNVTLVRPIYCKDLVLAALNNYVIPSLELNTNIQGAVVGLNKVIGITVDCGGSPRQITFSLEPHPRQIPTEPNISFSAQRLSAMEWLMIICHRASSDYRVEGTTVYIGNRN